MHSPNTNNELKASQDQTSEEELASTIKALALLEKHLNKMLERASETDAETVYVWDWEMLYEAIDPYATGSVFSGVLWKGLILAQESTVERTAKVIYAEGTRRELLWYLSKQLSEFHRRTRTQLDTRYSFLHEEEISPSKRFSERPDWKDVLENIGKLMRIDEAVDRLVLLLSKYAEPIPILPESVSQDRVGDYVRNLEMYRKSDARKTNEADAWNLACIDEWTRKGARGTDVGLVTATRVVRLVNEQVSRDPFYFALDMQMRTRFPRIRQRCIALHEILSQLHALSAQTRQLHLMAVGEERTSQTSHLRERAELRRREAKELFETLKEHLKDDAILNQISALLVQSAQALDDSQLQAYTSAAELDTSSARFLGLSQFEHKVTRALKALGVENPMPEDLDLAWRILWRKDDFIRLNFQTNTDQVLEAEMSSDTFAISWDAGVSIRGFLNSIEKEWEGTTRDSPLTARVWGMDGKRRTVFRCELKTPLELARKLADLGTAKLSMIRVVWDDFNFWFESSEQLSEEGRAVKLDKSRIAVSSLRGMEGGIDLARLYNETSKRWIFPSVVGAALTDLFAIT